MIMRANRHPAPTWFGLGLLILGGCAAPSSETTSPAGVPPLPPGMARVWVLRQQAPPTAAGGNIMAADPMVFVNGAPLAKSAQGTVFYHDFQPGTYRFTVQSFAFGAPANSVDTVQLTAGTQAYVQVQAVPNWEVGSSGGVSFAVLTTPSQDALPYFETVTNLGQR
jgi:hypothetical protein